MKKTFVVCGVLSIIFVFGATAGSESRSEKKDNHVRPVTLVGANAVKMMFFNVAPHIFIDANNGEIKGAVYELLTKHMAQEMGVTFIWDASLLTVIPRQLKLLETKQRYAAAVMIPTPERRKRFHFSEKTYFNSQTAIAVKEAFRLKKIQKIDDLLDLKIGYADKNFISPFMRDPRLQLDFVRNPYYHQVNFKKLLGNRLDAVYAPDKAALLYLVKKLDLKSKVKVINLPEKQSPFHIAFSKGSDDIRKKYDTAFNKLHGEKLYLEILKKYLDVSQL